MKNNFFIRYNSSNNLAGHEQNSIAQPQSE